MPLCYVILVGAIIDKWAAHNKAQLMYNRLKVHIEIIYVCWTHNIYVTVIYSHFSITLIV